MKHYFDELLSVEGTITKLRLNIYETWFEGKEVKKVYEIYTIMPTQRVYLDTLIELVCIIEFFRIGIFDENKKGLETWLSIIEYPRKLVTGN